MKNQERIETWVIGGLVMVFCFVMLTKVTFNIDVISAWIGVYFILVGILASLWTLATSPFV